MGKAQSKRSVDITTEPTKDVQEGTGELKKLEDVDQLKAQVNGDTIHTEAEAGVSHSTSLKNVKSPTQRNSWTDSLKRQRFARQ